VVVTGPSGSGKSSLAFDTIFAEGQRRYVESLSSYARRFLEQLPKPDVDLIEGLSPAISIRQRHGTKNPRSTVGTITEIYDFLRMLFSRIGQPHCPNCGRPVFSYTVEQMCDRILELPPGTRFSVLAPVIRNRRGGFRKELEKLRRDGFVRVSIDGVAFDLSENIELDKNRTHRVDVDVDRLSVKRGVRQRLAESIELASRLARGLVYIRPADEDGLLLSETLGCVDCGVSLPELSPRLFSFNRPEGACAACGGLGEVGSFHPDLIVPDPGLNLRDGAVAPWGKPGGAYYRLMIEKLISAVAVDIYTPWKALPEPIRSLVLHGTGTPPEAGGKAAEAADVFEGVIPGLERRQREYEKRTLEGPREIDLLEEEFDRFMVRDCCASCGGKRLRREALCVTVGGRSICDLTSLSLDETVEFFHALGELSPSERAVAEPVVRELEKRVTAIVDLGLGYLSLDRSMATLSTGERERIRLANQIGSNLRGVLYVLDEPSIGLHARDNERLIATLQSLRDRGNTVVVVEHDEATINAADHIVDLGPSAGCEGGQVMATGTPQEIAKHPLSPTGRYLDAARKRAMPRRRRTVAGREVVVRGASVHNLADITVRFPLGVINCVTGVSGSGKSSLVMDTLLPIARQRLNKARSVRGGARISGLEMLDRVVHVDQAPIGRTPRSNPATFVGVFGPIREVFADLPEARARGYPAARFSFNVKGGRCETCKGAGVLKLEMHFLPDLYVTCESCGGARYNQETLEIAYRGKTIADILAATVDEVHDLFETVPRIREQLEALRAIGLGYLELGQGATTLSGGEAQRLKLSKELARRDTGRTLYVLDEPTTGLHFRDVEVLMTVLNELVDNGNTVLVIEHNLDVILSSDHLIDLGPGGGANGGRVVATGTPEEIAEAADSLTAAYLRPFLT
jgi:excinuclease ABC subunit A